MQSASTFRHRLRHEFAAFFDGAWRVARVARTLTSAVTCGVALFACMSPVHAAGTLLAKYDFDEASGDALDTGSVPAANGALLGETTRTTNTPTGEGRAIDFTVPPAEGDLNYVNMGDVSKVDGLDSFTMTIWVNLQEDPLGNDRLHAKQDGGPDFGGFSWNINSPNEGDYTAGNFELGLFIGGVNGFGFARTDEDTGADDEWKFFAVSYDGMTATENMVFYQGADNRPVAQFGSKFNVAAGPVAAVAAPYQLGHTFAADGANTAPPGFLDDARVYGGILTAEELEVIRQENAPPPFVGDMDFNRQIDFDDINPFVLGLNDAERYESDFGVPAAFHGDVDGNGVFDFDDIAGFVALLGGGSDGTAAVVPEPSSLVLLLIAAAGLVGIARRR